MYWLIWSDLLPQWTVVGRHGLSGQFVTSAVDEASRNEPAVARIQPLSTEDCLVMDRPYRNCPAPHCALVCLVSVSSAVTLHCILLCLYWTVSFSSLCYFYCGSKFVPVLLCTQLLLHFTSVPLFVLFCPKYATLQEVWYIIEDIILGVVCVVS